ncbi:MAG: hypothetical protein ACRDPW_10015 [Mycobacteriales bacterium]
MTDSQTGKEPPRGGEAGQPYSRRDPYWGIDDYGRPLSYGRQSLYGPPEPADTDQLAQQLTYLQPRPDQRPIDPVALAAPSVFRPLWPVSAAPAVNRPLTYDEQATEWVDNEHLTVVAEPRCEPVSVLTAQPDTPQLPAYQAEPVVSFSQSYEAQPQLSGRYAQPYPEFVAPVSRQSSRGRGRLLVIALMVVVLVAVGALYSLSNSPDPAMSKNAGRTGVFQQTWQASDSRLSLDMVAVNDTIVSVECQAVPEGAENLSPERNVEHVTGRVVRTREKPETCSLIGRDLADGKPHWKLDRQPIGVALATIGPAVIAYGGEQALVVSAATGEITRTFSDGVLLGYTGATAVFTERLTDITSQAVAIDVTDGHQLWQTPIAQSPAAENARVISQASIAVPSGFDRMYYDGLGIGGRYVMVPDVATAGEYRIRDTATGKTVGPPSLVGSIFGVADGYALHVTEAEGDRVLHGTALGSVGATPTWSYPLPAGGYVAACSGLVCIEDVNSHRSVVLDPTSGDLIYQNDSGWSYVRRSGELAVMVRCLAAQGTSVCPAQDAAVEVVNIGDRAEVWSGKRPAFVAPQGSGDSFLVGLAREDGDSVDVLRFDSDVADAGEPATVGTVPLRALESVTLEGSSATAAHGSGKRTAVPNVSCVATESALSCGGRWTPMPVTTWAVAQHF